MKCSRICIVAVLAIVVGSAATAQAATVLFVSDNVTDATNIPTVLTGDGHTVTVVQNDFTAGPDTNAVLGGGGLAAYDAIFWSATGAQAQGSLHAASTTSNLSSYVSAGGYLFVTGYDSTASPDDPNLRALLGASGGFDVGGSPGAVISVANSLTTGVVNIMGVTPTGGHGDQDALSGLGAGTVGVVACNLLPESWHWTLRSLGSGEAAYVSNGTNDEDASWLNTSAGGAGAYNAALRNFAHAATATTVVVPVPAAAWLCLSLLGGLGVASRLRKRTR